MQINPLVPYLPDTVLEQAAVKLIHLYTEKFEPVPRPPIPVEKIADFLLELNIDWSAIPDDDETPILGCIVPATRTIIINERRRGHFDQFFGTFQYTLAHEIGHQQLHLLPDQLQQLPFLNTGSGQGYVCRHLTSQDRREWQAERFASYLLMPSFILLPLIEKQDLCNWSNLFRLRDQFQVSITALKKRLTDLDRLYIDKDGKLYRSKQEASGQGRLL